MKKQTNSCEFATQTSTKGRSYQQATASKNPET